MASLARSGSFKREVYGCEQEENEAEVCNISNKEIQGEGYEKTSESTEILDRNITLTSESDWSENDSDRPVGDSSSAQQEQMENLDIRESGVASLHEAAVEVTRTLDSEASCDVNNTDAKHDVVKTHDVSSKCEPSQTNDEAVEVELKDVPTALSSEVLTGNTADQSEPQEDQAEANLEKSSDNGEWI